MGPWCVLSWVGSGGGPDIVLTTYSGRPYLVYLSIVLVDTLLLPYRNLTHGHLSRNSCGCNSYTGDEKFIHSFVQSIISVPKYNLFLIGDFT